MHPRWMVVLTLGAIGWMGAVGGASAQEDGPPPGKVRISLLSPDERALKLYIVSGPEGATRGKACKLPCEVDLIPGTYRVRFRKRGLVRSWPRSFKVTGSAEYSVSYRSRGPWRKAGGVLLLASTVVAIVLFARAATVPEGFLAAWWQAILVASGLWVLAERPGVDEPDFARGLVPPVDAGDALAAIGVHCDAARIHPST
jgi:hypothetical protein